MKTLHRVGWLLPVLLLQACVSYRAGFPRPEGLRTVFVEVFGNDTFRRGVELELTEKIQKELMEQTGLILENKKEADAILQGKIIDIYDQRIIGGRANETRGGSIWILAEAEIVRPNTGTVISTLTISDRAKFFLDNGEDTQTATAQATERLARRIVLGLVANLTTKDREKEILQEQN